MSQFVEPQRTEDVLDWTVALAREAGSQARDFFGSQLTKTIKSHPIDYATEADIAIEKFLVGRIQERFPSDAILAEESGWIGSKNASHTWIIDPIDGTHNFASEIPEYGVMIARAQRDQVELAVVYNPSLDVLAAAQKGKGTTLNGEQVTAPESPVLEDARLIIGKTLNQQQRKLMTTFRKRRKEIRDDETSLGSAASSCLHVLQKKRTGYVCNQVQPWDAAPVHFLLAEAGYTTSTLSGEPYTWSGDDQSFLIAPSTLHGQLLSIIEEL